MALIEFLCISSVIETIGNIDEVKTWKLSDGWEEKTFYLCMDGLSLDRHRSFERKLVNLPFSYAKAFRQAIVFQMALSGVVLISGPLQIAFHMPQSIYIIYKDMMKWSQNVVNWNKINVNKVSETFDTCWQLCMITLDKSNDW